MQELQKTCVRSLGQEVPLEEGVVTHSSIFAWRIPWTQEPGGLQSIGSQRVTQLKQRSMHSYFQKEQYLGVQQLLAE